MRGSAQAAMMQADRDFCRAVAERDIERFKTFVADDGVFRGSDGAAVRGPEAVAAVWAPLMAADRKVTLTWEPKRSEAAASGDLGYTEGEYERTATDADGNTVKSYGTYVTIWRRHPDGHWQVIVDIGTAPRGRGQEVASDE